jgi:hypothetical protein
MRKSLRKGMLLLTVVIILMFMVAAGIDSAGIHLTERISLTVLTAIDTHTAMIVLFSVWLITVGMMCRNLKKIPGVKSNRSDSNIRHN